MRGSLLIGTMMIMMSSSVKTTVAAKIGHDLITLIAEVMLIMLSLQISIIIMCD